MFFVHRVFMAVSSTVTPIFSFLRLPWKGVVLYIRSLELSREKSRLKEPSLVLLRAGASAILNVLLGLFLSVLRSMGSAKRKFLLSLVLLKVDSNQSFLPSVMTLW